MDAVDEVVRFESVCKAFADNVVFEDLDLSIRKGEVLTILGASGSGKSVLLKMMLGLIPSDTGRIIVLGHDITGLDDRAMLAIRKRVGMVFQSAALFDSLSVFENIAYPLIERGMDDESDLRDRVAEALRMVDMAGTEAVMPPNLSGGMRRRVGLARAVVQAPELLLYDDPTSGLDPINVRRVDELILSLRRRLGLTSVVVTHDIATAYMVSDRLALLAERRIVEVSEVAQFRASKNPHVRAFLDATVLPKRAPRHTTDATVRTSQPPDAHSSGVNVSTAGGNATPSSM
jgi:phospholipid/cholesterol/gamma-HCH transport system ATP-binding protein